MRIPSLRLTISLGSMLAGLVIAVLVPLAYGAMRYADEVRMLEFLATLTVSGPLQAQAFDRPLHWELIDDEGNVIAQQGEAPGWPTILHAKPVRVGVKARTLQLEASLQSWLADVGGVTVVCMLLGGGLTVGMRRLSLRLLDRMVGEQQAESLRFHTAINNMSQGLCFFDGSHRLIVCNERYVDLYRLPRTLAQPGTTLREIVDARFEAGTFPDMSRAEYLRWRTSIAIANKPSETVITLKDGRTFAIHHEPMPDGGWVATHEDVTERRRAQEQIERMARHDALTGLPNRVLFRERLNEVMVQSRAGLPIAVLCIDLDRFKAVNDTLGHPVGDQLLRAAAQRLGECVRQTDLVARLGGDEFAIIQTDAVQPVASKALADRLVRTVSAPFEIAGHQVVVGASVGVVVSPQDGVDPDELLKKADMALYDAKSAGRGTHSFFLPHMGEQAQGRRELEIDLRLALESGQIEVHYQPIMGMHTGRVLAFEALLRWRHPVRGMVMPDGFIPLAEETGLIAPLGEWMLQRAFADAMHWPADVSVAANLSPMQFKSGGLVRVVEAALQSTGLPASRVELEITESVRLAEDSINLGILRALHALGLRICLDDFGVGYSSLSYLRSFPFKKIKIDRSFVRDVVGNTEAAAIIQSIAMLGRSLNMAITAEGVENPEQLHKLRQLGCDEAQGYYLGRPRPSDEVKTMLKEITGSRQEYASSGRALL